MPASKKRTSAPSKARPTSPAEFAPGVFVGGWKDAQRFEGSRFCVLDEAPPDMPVAVHVTIYDGDRDRPIRGNLDGLVRQMRAAHDRGAPVLVFCGHGVRRSPLAAAWYLHRQEGMPLAQAYERLRSVRPQVEEAHEWIGDVADLQDA